MIYSLGLKPFTDFWADCRNNSLFTIVTTFEPSYKYLAYLNDYRYIIINEKNFGDILIVDSFSEGIVNYLANSKKVFTKRDYYFKNDDNFLEELQELLKNKQVLVIGVDLFYWHPESVLWQTHHTSHHALLDGFDSDRDVYFTIEDDYYGNIKIYEIPGERFKLAYRNSTYKNPPIIIFDIAKDIEPYKLTLKNVRNCAKRLIKEISAFKINGIWQIEGKKGSYGIIESCLWGLKTVINRHKGNQFLFKALYDLKLVDDKDLCEELIQNAKELERGWTTINNHIIKYKVSDEEEFDSDILYDLANALFQKECEMWKRLLKKSRKKLL